MPAQLYLIEMDFDQDSCTMIDHEAIERTIDGALKHMTNRGLFSCLCEPPRTVSIVAVTALRQPICTIVLLREPGQVTPH